MDFRQALKIRAPLLMEGSMYERMRQRPDVEFDPAIAHAGLIYDDDARNLLSSIHREYMEVAIEANLPMLISAGTWRATRERIAQSRYADRPVNQEHVAFVRGVCDEQAERGGQFLLGGVMGPAGDAYRPEQALDSAESAHAFHRHQADALAEAGVDFLVAMTLPSIVEARGLARAMAETTLPYVLSFVVRDSGRLLDETPIGDAITSIDDDASAAPEAYLVNCVHPTVFDRAMEQTPLPARQRIIGLKANTSALSPEQLDSQSELLTQEPADFAQAMSAAKERWGLNVLGGCCGTDTRHIKHIAPILGGRA